jgi:hypothetical protein
MRLGGGVWELGEKGWGVGLFGNMGTCGGGWERGNTHLIPMINTWLDVIIPTCRVKKGTTTKAWMQRTNLSDWSNGLVG